MNIIDDRACESSSEKENLYWNTYDIPPAAESILVWQEKFFYETRSEFLLFVHTCGEQNIQGKPLRDWLRLADGFSAWWITKIFERHPQFYGSALFEIFKLRALEHFLEGKSVSCIHLYSSNSALSEVLKSLCAAKSINFVAHTGAPGAGKSDKRRKEGRWRRLQVKLLAELSNTFCGHLFVQTRKAWRWWRRERRQFPRKPRVWKRKGILLGTWFPNVDSEAARQGIFRSKYWEGAHDVLRESGKFTHWFFCTSTPVEALASDIRLRDRLLSGQEDRMSMTFWQECVRPQDALKAWWAWLCILWRMRPLTPHLSELCRWPGSLLNVYPLLMDIWQDSLHDFLLHNLFYYGAVRHYCKLIGAQKMCITSSELQFWERMLFKAARAEGTATCCAAMHTRISPADFRYFISPLTWGILEFLALMPDMFYANGQAGFEAMLESGFPPARLGLLEAVRFMYLADGEISPGKTPTKLLVATSYFASETRRMLKTLAQAMHKKNLPIFENIIIKPHPFCAVDTLVASFFKKKPQIVAGKIQDYFVEDTIVYTDSTTSVALSALYKGLPLIVHNTENNFDLGCMQNIPGLPFVHDENEFLSALESARCVKIEKKYFCLDPDLTRWRKLLKSA